VVLASVKKKLDEASTKLEQTSVRARAMDRALRDVEALPSADAPALLGLALDVEEDVAGR
jgi:DNA recombination protein RmuC